MKMTKHAEIRFAQRFVSSQDVDLIMRLGSETHEGFMVLERDYQTLERDVKQLLKRVRCLVGKRIVVESGQVVTGYQCTKRKEKQLLQRSKEKGASLC